MVGGLLKQWFFSRAAASLAGTKAAADAAIEAAWRRLTLALTLLLFSLSITTALASGFLVGVGLDFIAFADKWAIIAAILFYWSIALAILSPLLALPQSVLAASKADGKKMANARAENHEALKKWQSELDMLGPVPGKIAALFWADKNAARRAELIEAIEGAEIPGTTPDQAKSHVMRSALRYGCYFIYSVTFLLSLIVLMGGQGLVPFTAYALFILFVAWRLHKTYKGDALSVLRIISPMVVVGCVGCGVIIGQQVYTFPLNTALTIGPGTPTTQRVSMVLSTERGYLVVAQQGACAKDRHLSFLPREIILKAVVERPAWSQESTLGGTFTLLQQRLSGQAPSQNSAC